MNITSTKHEELVQKLMSKRIELYNKGETKIKAYEIGFQYVIEEVFPDKCWWEVTECQIFNHLLALNNPTETVIDIIRKLKED